MHALAPVLHAALPWLSRHGHAAVQAVVVCNGRIVTAGLLATRLGLHSRHQLARALRHEGLPGIEELSAWIRVLGWLFEWEQRRVSLFHLAIHRDLEPPTCYRVVKRVTGVKWTEARSQGFDRFLVRFLDRCHEPDSAWQEESAQLTSG